MGGSLSSCCRGQSQNRLPSGAAIFDPLSLSPDGWWKSTDGVFADSSFETPATDESDVNGWQDQSGNSSHVNQTLANRNLEYYDNETDNINDLPVVRCPGGLDYLFNNGLAKYQPSGAFSFFCVLKASTIASDYVAACQGSQGWIFGWSSSKPYFRFYDGSNLFYNIADTEDAMSADTLYSYGFIWDDGVCDLVVNGISLDFSPAGDPVGAVNYTGSFFNLGGWSASGSGFDGDLTEAILIPSNITDSVADLHSYFADRHGIGA